ncbi:MAG: FkbM family methyltransferase, partial [Candidatus Omnitrophica bacterium]|nr:FkbM family methyltransferase [Candidatus Omnitrophota bacterium]
EAIEILNNNLKNNNIKNVNTVKAAIGTDGKFIDFVTYPGFNVINHHSAWQPALYTKLLVRLFTAQRDCRKSNERVCAVSLGRIISDYCPDRVNVLKIDAEGSEYEVFRNLSNEDFGKIDKIIMEFHEYYPGNRHKELVSILASKGFNVRVEKPMFDYYFGKCGFIWAWKDKKKEEKCIQ